jgi:choline monooxygenase
MTIEPQVGLQPALLAPSSYYDAEAYARERAAIFARAWLFAGDTTQLPARGACLAVEVAGFPVLIVSDGDTLRAFHNVCRHRGGPIAGIGESVCKTLVCQYHGWTYGLDGSLHNARDFGADVPAGELGLQPVRVDTWRGLVFVNLDAGAPPLVEWLGGFAEACAPYPMESFRPRRRSDHDIAANWKVYAENYQEGYHIPLVHPGLNAQVDARQYRVEVRDGYSVHTAPTRDGSVTSGVWLWKFPGLALNAYPDGMCVESYAPTGPAGTRVSYAFYFADGTSDDEIAATIASSDTILDEDRMICEAVQRNMACGLYERGVLSPRHEAGVEDVQRQVLAALAVG